MSQEITVKGKATRIRGATWTHDQVKKLFDVWMQPHIYNGLLNEKKKQDIFKNMAASLQDLGVQRTWSEIRAKIKNLKADFRKAMERKTPFRYYDQMWKFMNLDGSAAASTSYDDDGGGSTSENATTPRQIEEVEEILVESDNGDENTDVHDNTTVCSISDTVILPHSYHASDEETSNTSAPASFRPSAASTPYHEGSYHAAYPHHQQDAYVTDPHSSISQSQQQQPYCSDVNYYHQGKSQRIQQEPEKRHHYHQHQEETLHEIEHDSSSRSSMIITHVVSNVIEPVTTVVMPSSNSIRGNTRNIAVLPEAEPLPVLTDQQPLRLEFVMDNENVVLRHPSPIERGNEVESHLLASSPQTNTSQIINTEKVTTPRSPTARHSPYKEAIPLTMQKTKSLSLQRQRFKQKRSSASTSSATAKGKTQEGEPAKKRKLLESLNRQTMETISSLLVETSHNLLKEIQDAEKRFISWEEEKRNEERKREEIMFSKLITAMNSAYSTRPSSQNPKGGLVGGNVGIEDTQQTSLFVSGFTNVSKQLNEMMNDEIKSTEETIRQWEVKMQRQESRHSEKLFAMIVNAFKTPLSDDAV